MIHTIEHWRAVTEQDEDPINWALTALALISRQALFPENFNLNDSGVNTSRAILARCPDELMALGMEYEKQLREFVSETEENLGEIDQDLENFDLTEE